MNWGMRTLSLISLAFGLVATGVLALAVATDFWLFTSEPWTIPQFPNVTVLLKAHSGLWRSCVYEMGE